jgi:hypothetical protein
MKYKIPRPEDDKSDCEYVFKVIKAYSKISSDTLILLCSIEGILNVFDEVEPEYIKEKLQELLNDYKS